MASSPHCGDVPLESRKVSYVRLLLLVGVFFSFSPFVDGLSERQAMMQLIETGDVSSVEEDP